MTEITVTTVPFSRLVAGDEINARTKTREGIDELAASIAAKGLIQPLAVRPGDKADTFEVIDGRRRHQAIAKLVKDKTWKKTDPVPVIVRNEDDADALETSLAANTVRLPMHPVDQHDVFVRLVDQGRSEADIAARFGISEKTVRQQIALGRLAPVVREAWRKGKITPETARAFTLHPDHDVQAEAFEQLKRGGGVNEYAVRQALSRERVEIDDYRVVFVGIDAYVAAGGKTTDSLFDDGRFVDDAALLDKLVRDKLTAEATRIKADGWAWVALASDLPNRWPEGWRDWPTLKDDDRDYDAEGRYRPEDFSPEQRARSGVVIDLDEYEDDPLYIHMGVVRPAADGQTDIEDATDARGDAEDGDDDTPDHPFDEIDKDVGGDETSEPDGPFAITDALLQSLTEAQTVAAQRALAEDPHLALAALLATLTTETGSSSPLRVTLDGYGKSSSGYHRDRQRWADLVAFNANTLDVLAADLAPLIARALDLRSRSHSSFVSATDRRDVAALIDRLPADAYLTAAREEFLAEDYFKRARKETALAAIGEMRAAGAAADLAPDDVLANMKKGDLVTAATQAATACGWLPPELRHPAYEIAAPAREAPKAKRGKPKTEAA